MKDHWFHSVWLHQMLQQRAVKAGPAMPSCHRVASKTPGHCSGRTTRKRTFAQADSYSTMVSEHNQHHTSKNTHCTASPVNRYAHSFSITLPL